MSERGVKLPLTMGHENVGEVVAAGPEANAIAAIDDAAPEALQQIFAHTNGGAWAVIDFVGSSATVSLGNRALIKGGKLVVVGLFGGEVTIPTLHFPMRAMTIQRSYVSGLSEMTELLELVNRTGLPSTPIVTRPLYEPMRAQRPKGWSRDRPHCADSLVPMAAFGDIVVAP